jgi:hypothetical protein
MYAAGKSAHSSRCCSPAADQRFAPIGGCLCKKQLDLFVPFANISKKIETDAFATICRILLANENRSFYRRSKKKLPTDNNIRLNRDDSGRVLFITIDVELGSERTTRRKRIK